MSWKNRLKNIVATPMRLLGSAWYAGIDIAKTWTSLVKDPAKISMNTIQDIQELFQEAGKRWTMRHKAVNLPWATALSWVKIGEWTIRSWANTVVNFIKNSWWTLKNFWSNVLTSFAHTFSTKPISDISFKHLSTEAVSKNWDMKKFLIAAGVTGSVATIVPQVQATSQPAPVAAEASKLVVDEDSKKTISDLTYRFEQQEKTNQELQKTIIGMKDQIKNQTQFTQQQLKQKDDIIAAFQKDNTKQIVTDSIGNQVENISSVDNVKEAIDSKADEPKNVHGKKKKKKKDDIVR